MIELRWLWRKDAHLNDERVLQYRTQYKLEASNSWLWTEWQDVPEVRE